MFTITEIVKEGILEIQFSSHLKGNKFYQIVCTKGMVWQQGKIDGYTQRTCLYVGNLKKGNYSIKIDETELKSFSIL